MMGPMQKLYSRHLDGCDHREDIYYLACDCPKWVRGKIRGRSIRKSTKENSERLAWRVVNDWIDNGLPEEETHRKPTSIEDAAEDFIKACTADGNTESTLSYKRLVIKTKLVEFCRDKKIQTIDKFTAECADKFRASWTQAAPTRAKMQRVFKAFGNWAVRTKLIPESFAAGLKPATGG